MTDTDLREQILHTILGEYASSEGQYVDTKAKFLIDDIVEFIHARDRALLAKIRAELPESIYSKLDKCPYCGNPYQYSCTCDVGFDAAIAEVTAILTKMEEQL